MIRAAVDLGTNTFHLLIAEIDNKTIKRVIWKDRQYVFLADQGLEHLSDVVFRRAINALRGFRKKIEELKIEDVRIIGTEALRKAENGPLLSQQISEILGFPIDIISGQREAELIAKGIQLAIGDDPISAHVMDIGGGSTELITFKEGKPIETISETCGIGYLYNRFHTEEPISRESEGAMRDYIVQLYQPYLERHKGQGIHLLIGVAGSFEVLQHMSGGLPRGSTPPPLLPLPVDLVEDLLRSLRAMNLRQRAFFPGLPKERRKYIVEALIIMDQIMKMANIQQLMISSYSIKHGLLIDDF